MFANVFRLKEVNPFRSVGLINTVLIKINITMDENEIISAFAFKTGKQIEQLIKEQTDNLQERNQMIEARILNWYAQTKDEKFAEFMGIEKAREGRV